MFLEVIVDLIHTEVDKIFEYSTNDITVEVGSRVFVPFGNKVIEGIVVNKKETSEYPKERIKPILRVIEDVPALTKETLALAKNIKETCFVTMASALRLFLPSEMRKGKVKEQYTSEYFINDGANLEEMISSLKKTAIKQKELLEFLSKNGRVDGVELNKHFGASAVKGLLEKGYIFKEKTQKLRSPYGEIQTDSQTINLTPKQILAVKSIKETDKTVTLLHGVTGSGKTEVYLKLINDVIESGRTAIMTVPEISLTPQMLRQLRSRFGDKAAILHSGLSSGERFDEWWRLRNGQAKIAIGARSAIFAPVENLGLIIIDEEHDGSYFSETSPRYSTVAVAKFRAEYNKAKLVLGSATPEIETYMLAQNGEYNLATLPDRINKKPLPNVEIVDMRKEVRRGNNSPFSRELLDGIEECLNNGNQAIIFLNQRGYSKTVVCTECGHVQKCTDCDVSLTYHMEDNALLCHYCGAKYKMIKACTECGSPYIRHGGAGTERIQRQLKELFPSARILRMDRDTTQNKEGHFKILNEFSQKKADILVGTQMIAKGHDFPSVTLVGILDADMSLHFSDYRSGERTFQLLTQVAGRSGRSDKAGKVVLQTYSPENLVLRQAIRYDYEGFFSRELSIRKATGFPPFTDIVRILIKSQNDQQALDTTKALYTELNEIYTEQRERFRFFGCMKAPLKRLQNQYRYQIIMRLVKPNFDLLKTIYYTQDKYNGRAVTLSLEINPNNLT